MAERHLNRSHLEILTNFYKAGGAGELDRHLRVVYGPQRNVMPGAPGVWMVLVAEGFVAGEDGCIMLTEAGRERAERNLREMEGVR